MGQGAGGPPRTDRPPAGSRRAGAQREVGRATRPRRKGGGDRREHRPPAGRGDPRADACLARASQGNGQTLGASLEAIPRRERPVFLRTQGAQEAALRGVRRQHPDPGGIDRPGEGAVRPDRCRGRPERGARPHAGVEGSTSRPPQGGRPPLGRLPERLRRGPGPPPGGGGRRQVGPRHPGSRPPKRSRRRPPRPHHGTGRPAGRGTARRGRLALGRVPARPPARRTASPAKPKGPSSPASGKPSRRIRTPSRGRASTRSNSVRGSRSSSRRWKRWRNPALPFRRKAGSPTSRSTCSAPSWRAEPPIAAPRSGKRRRPRPGFWSARGRPARRSPRRRWRRSGESTGSPGRSSPGRRRWKRDGIAPAPGPADGARPGASPFRPPT